MDTKSSKRRLHGLSAHAIALTALFVALGSGAYAAITNIAPNSVGPKQIQEDAVGSSEIAKKAIDAANLKAEAIKAQALADKSVGEQQLKAEAVGQENLKALAVGLQQLQDQAVNQQKLADHAVNQQKLGDAAVGLQQLQAESVSEAKLKLGAVAAALAKENSVGTLYTNNNDTGLNITTDTQIASLSLPAGSYLVFGSVEAVHGPNPGSATRLECYTTGDAGLVDFAKERLQSNANATESLIFTKQTLTGPATLASDGTINYRCTTTGNASTITLSQIHFQAVRLAKVVAQ